MIINYEDDEKKKKENQVLHTCHGIRFPFRVISQPEHCGYPHPGFTLSCAHTNDTVIELTISVKLSIKWTL
jgi:hypothetical protein